ncbi:hypothetical protein ACGFZL_07050 [Streptomyces sp. NPDC048182]|uniref:hypothetical protein n=1 Tax=Streptomyces sp. NPDC048182 TaxID=3365507 RepID=UPI00372427FB
MDVSAVVGVAPEVHRFYRVEKPGLTEHVRLMSPAYACEFSGQETLEEAVTRYRALGLTDLDRDPLPVVKMRFANTRTRGRSTDQGRARADPRRLFTELRSIEGDPGSFVEFENRHGSVWRVEWHGTYLLAEWNEPGGPPRIIELENLVEFAKTRLRVSLEELGGSAGPTRRRMRRPWSRRSTDCGVVRSVTSGPTSWPG